MDSVTQIVLGAACADAALGHRVGRKAALWGAVLGTLPDLDTFYPFGDPVAAFVLHRGYSHSYFVLSVLACAAAWLACKIHPYSISPVNHAGRNNRFRAAVHETQQRHPLWRGWLALCLLSLLTHPLLDSFTIYGTQVARPFSSYPVGWSTIFIIDPLYTIPLLLGLGFAMWRPARRFGTRFALPASVIGLIVSSAYLATTVAIKLHVESAAQQALTRLELPYDRYLTTPAPFNVALWRIVAINEATYWEGFYSWAHETSADIRLRPLPAGHALLSDVKDSPPVSRLTQFSKGFYAVRETPGGDIRIQDLRMGALGRYVFTFTIAKRARNDSVDIIPTAVERTPPARPTWELIKALMHRIVDSRALEGVLPPA
jgi:inner membrane protein